MKWIVTGSAPIPLRVLEELKCLFSINIINGWGMTENCALGTCTLLNDKKSGHVG